MSRILIARDGLRARDNGSWGEIKLSFLDHYCPPAIQATAKMQHRYYIDLFAGPGRNVVRGTDNQEFDGSPIRVLGYQSRGANPLAFTNAVFVNANRLDHEALQERIRRLVALGGSKIPPAQIRCIHGDANREISQILATVPHQAYVMVFADMEAPKQWPWESMQALKSQGHRSVDVYTLLPLDMAIVRLLSYKENGRKKYANILDRFFGVDRWRQIADERTTAGRSGEMRQGLTELYLEQMRTLWRHAGPMIDVNLRGKQRLYKMMFASNHEVASRIAGWIRDHSMGDGQGSLFG